MQPAPRSVTLTDFDGVPGRTLTLPADGDPRVFVLREDTRALTWSTASGVWDVAATPSWRDAADVQAVYREEQTPGDAAFFDDSADGPGPHAVALGQAVRPSNAVFTNETEAYTLAGPGALDGVMALVKAGAGALTLASDHTFTGGVFLAGGRLNADSPSALGAPGSTLTLAGGSLGCTAAAAVTLSNYAVSCQADFTFAGPQTLDLGGGPVTLVTNRTITVSAGTLILGGPVSGAGLTKDGTGLLTLNRTNSYSGLTRVLAGTLKTGVTFALGSMSPGAEVCDGATLDLDGQNLGAEPVSVAGAGVGGAGAIVNSGAPQIRALRFVKLTAAAAFGGTSRWEIRNNATATFDMGGFMLNKTGTNQVSLVGVVVSNPGHVDVRQGVFSLETSTAPGGGPANNLTVRSGATLQYYQLAAPVAWSLTLHSNATVYASSGSGTQNTWSGPVSVGGPATLSCAAAQTVRGCISGVGSLLKTGSRTATLAADNTYSGGTAVTAGTLQLGDGAAANGSVLGDITNSATLLFANPLPLLYAGSITGTGRVVKAAAGRLALAGASRYTGGTALGGGRLAFATNALGASGLVTVSTNAALEWLAGNVQDLSARLRVEDGVTLTLDTGSNDVAFAAALQLGAARSAALVKAGAGALTLAATNLYAGLTTVSNGTLRLAVTNALRGGASVALAGGALDLNGMRQTLGALGGAGTLRVSLAAGAPGDDRLVVTGRLDLASLRLSLADARLLNPVAEYRVAAAGVLAGTFAGVLDGDEPAAWVPHYDAAAGVVTLRCARGTRLWLE